MKFLRLTSNISSMYLLEVKAPLITCNSEIPLYDIAAQTFKCTTDRLHCCLTFFFTKCSPLFLWTYCIPDFPTCTVDSSVKITDRHCKSQLEYFCAKRYLACS